MPVVCHQTSNAQYARSQQAAALTYAIRFSFKLEPAQKTNQCTRQARVRELKGRRQSASIKISALARGRKARRRVSETKQEYEAAIVIQRTARGRSGRKRAKTRADQQRGARRRTSAAIKIQKVARGSSKRARHSVNDFNDRDLYSTKSDAGEDGASAGAAPLDEGSALPSEQQQGINHSLQHGDGPKRVGFVTNPSASEEAIALVALDLDERVRSFVAVQATVRRCETKVAEAVGSRRTPATSEKNGADDVSESDTSSGHGVPSSVEIETEREREQENLSESDFGMSLSLSESLGQDTTEGEQEEGWKSDFALDDTSGDALAISEEARNRPDKPHEDNTEIPESLTRGGDKGQDGDSGGKLAVLEGAQSGEDEEPEDQVRGSEDDGASVIAAELAELAVWEAKVSLFLESRPDSSQEASEHSASAVSLEAMAGIDAEALGLARAEETGGNGMESKKQHNSQGVEHGEIHTAVDRDVAGSLESAQVVEPGHVQQTAEHVASAAVDAEAEGVKEKLAVAAGE